MFTPWSRHGDENVSSDFHGFDSTLGQSLYEWVRTIEKTHLSNLDQNNLYAFALFLLYRLKHPFCVTA